MSAQRELLTKLPHDTSRSFYRTLRLLPGEARFVKSVGIDLKTS